MHCVLKQMNCLAHQQGNYNNGCQLDGVVEECPLVLWGRWCVQVSGLGRTDEL